MTRLSEKKHWESVNRRNEEDWAEAQKEHGVEPEAGGQAGKQAGGRGVKRLLRSVLGGRVLALAANYEDHLLWDVIYKEHMPGPGARVLEVGSAPGEHLVMLSRRFGLDPYGVEYSESGVRVNREVFAAAGFDPEHVIHADFFSDEFQRRHAGGFDVVLSRGFIEHFDDVEDVVRKHVNLLAEGGRLFIVVPNVRGFNHLLSWVFHKEVIAIHNLKIMEGAAFAGLFKEGELRRLFCDYYGVFSFYIFNTKEGSPMRHLLKLCFLLQPPLNVAFRLLLRPGRGSSRWFSPGLIFVGVKR